MFVEIFIDHSTAAVYFDGIGLLRSGRFQEVRKANAKKIRKH